VSTVVVVGAGLGGLSAACHLLGGGHDVVVVERDAVPGGRAGSLQLGAYRFDTGPTVLTMPELLREAFEAAGQDMDALLTLKALDPMYRATFADGSVLSVRAGREAMADEIATVCGPGEADAYRRFCEWLTELYRIEMGNFIDRNFDAVTDVIRPLAPALRLVRHGGFRRLGRVVDGFFADERLRRIFSFQSMYAGLAPYEALALYGVITYMDCVEGVFFPEGGIHAVATAMAKAVTLAGGELRYGAPVARVLRVHGSTGEVCGVELAGGERLAADAVVVNADLPVAYRELLGGLDAPRAARRGRYSPSCVVWHAGVRGELPAGTAHHNIHFGREWASSFRAVIRDGRLMPDPSILVTVHSLDDPGAAPAGAHTLYVLEPVPNLDGRVDWTAERDGHREDLARRVGALGYPAEPEVEAFVDPLDWERLGMERGTPFALAHTFAQTGPFRPANVDRRAPGLVFTGSGTVPGVGVPMVLVSGKLAARRVDEIASTR